ncbi:PRC-barrel domain-containing protein [Tessaracoccus terricola]
MNPTDWDAWNYRKDIPREAGASRLVGFEVHATDGHIGKVDAANDDVDNSQIVVDTGPWIFGRTVLLPAGCIERIDSKAEEIHVSLTKEQIKASPELGDAMPDDAEYRDALGAYYGDVFLDRTGKHERTLE